MYHSFLDALASLDFKLSVRQSLSDSPFSIIKASASTGLSDYFSTEWNRKKKKQLQFWENGNQIKRN